MSQNENSDARMEASAASDQDIQAVHAALLHDQQEPDQGYSLMPLFMLGFVSTMIFIVAIYFIHNRAGLSDGLGVATTIHHKGYDPQVHGGGDVDVEVDAFAVGKTLYTQVCVACHQINGQGLPGAFPPLVGSDWVTGDEERLIKVVLHGLQGPIEVNGAPYNGIMPAFGPSGTYKWGDDKIAYALTYIRQEWGNAAGEITPEQVTAVKEATASQTAAYTAGDL
jgi:mono/diheme cytochrome c family protein